MNGWMNAPFNIDTVVALFKYYIIIFWGEHMPKPYADMITEGGSCVRNGQKVIT